MTNCYLLIMSGADSFRTFQRMRRKGQRAMAMLYLDLAAQDGYQPAYYAQRQIKTRI
jgi:hypothetical protein